MTVMSEGLPLNSKYIKIGLEEGGFSKGGNFIYPMMHPFILYYQDSERT